MKLSLTTKIALALLLAGAVAVKVVPQSIVQALLPPGPADATSQHYELVPDSIYDGDTLRVSDGNREIKVRLCGIDAPEK